VQAAEVIAMLLWICDAAQVRLAEQKPFSCPMSTNTCYGCRPASGTAFVSFPETAHVTYKSTGFYSFADERTIAWDDSDLKIDWQLEAPPILSQKDKLGVHFRNAEVFE